MTTVALTDDQWQKMLPFLRSCPTAYVGDETHCRRFVEAVLWIARSGAQWRLLPQSYGNWNHIDKGIVNLTMRACCKSERAA